MFQNTYQHGFYKQLHRYVHTSYRKHIAIETTRNLFIKPASISFGKIRKASFFTVLYTCNMAGKAKTDQN